MKKTYTKKQIAEAIAHWQNVLSESEEDTWLDGYLKNHPDALTRLLSWIQKKNPGMSADAQERFARNILKKKHREGKLDADSSAASSSQSSSAPRQASPEDEEKFCREITNYGVRVKDGQQRPPENRWLLNTDGDSKQSKSALKSGYAKILFYKPVGIDADGKVLVDVYSSTHVKTDSWNDGDYDDGRLHSWTSVQVVYEVDPSKKVGEEVGEIRDGKVVLSNGTVLEGWGSTIRKSWTENSRWRSKYSGYGKYYESISKKDNSMEKKYTKKQITEAIAYWKKQLKTVSESSDYSSQLLTKVPVTAILESLDVFDECASWGKISGVDSYKTKFSGESAQKVASAFSGASDYSLKFLGISNVMSREEYAEYAEQHESDKSYDDYIDDEMYMLKDALSRKQLVGSLFKPRKVLVIDNVVFNDKPGKTVFVVLYEMQ